MDSRETTLQPASPDRGRNHGIDLLRVVSMFYVLLLHTIGHGGVLDAAQPHTLQYAFAWFLEIWAYGAVNIFALISGYVSYTDKPKSFRLSSYIVLWLQVVACGVAVTLICKLVQPDLVSPTDLVRTFFPVTANLHWYFTAYTGLFLLLPLLNAGIRGCSKRMLRRLFVGMILIFCCYERFAGRFGVNAGYSTLWLALLYVLGAIIKKCDIGSTIKPWQAFLAAALCALTGWGWLMLTDGWQIAESVNVQLLFVSYLSPTVLAASILHLIGFAKLRIHPRFQRAVSFASQGAFAVYLLNTQRIIWSLIAGRFAYLCNSHPAVLLLHIMTFCLIFLTAAILLDHVRIRCFRALRIRERTDRLVAAVDRRLFGNE